MNEVRLGVIGCGGMARGHMNKFGQLQGLKFVSAADPVEANRNAVAEQHGVKVYEDGYELINSGEVDAIFIGTPHYFHPPYAIAAFEKGLHVLTEKPVAVTAKAAQEMTDAADKRPELVYSAMFQFRTVPLWRTVKRLIDSGEVGQLVRANWTITTWFRSQAYYDSGTWRATWKGEGGGVLLNQCPHNLDIFTWLVGLPTRVQAIVNLGRFHEIEVEDDVTAMMQFENGATGTFITNTGEAPGVDRFEIVGDRSTLIIEPGKNRITQHRSHHVVSEFCRTSQQRFGGPVTDEQVITPGGQNTGHAGIWQSFIDAILHGKPDLAPGREGIKGLELGNAILMSGVTQQPVNLPTDREAYDQLLKELIEKSPAGKQTAGV